MTDEEKAMTNFKNNFCSTCEDKEACDVSILDCTFYDTIYKQAYLDGLVEGKLKWHDLRKDPNDLPEDDRQCLCLTSDCYFVGYYDEEYDQEWHFDEFCTNKIDAWCELQKFEE